MVDSARRKAEYGAFFDRGGVMAKVVHCPCGTDVNGESDDELVTNVEQHVQERHPDMVGKMSREDILGQAEEA